MQPQGPTWYVWAGGVAWQSCVASLAGPGSWYLVLSALDASSLGLGLTAERLEGACCIEGDLLVVAAQNNNSNKNQTEELSVTTKLSKWIIEKMFMDASTKPSNHAYIA